jgi:hypothetical protein
MGTSDTEERRLIMATRPRGQAFLGSLVVVAALLASQGIARADSVSIAGTGTLGDFTGTFAYDALTHTVDINLTNTSPAAHGGFLTGVVFNIPDVALVTGATLVTSNANFTLLGGPSFSGGVSASPFGAFDIGAALGGDWLGGGSPTGGAAVGQSVDLKFTLTGSAALGSLTAADFLNTASTAGGKDDFAVRFKGFVPDGSDKVLGHEVPPPTGSVPEPGTLVLLAAGLAGMVAWKVRMGL